MKQLSDFTIVGGGISGLLTARELVQENHTVTIVEKSELGRESSWAGGGILLPLYPWRQSQAISDLVMASLKIYPALSEQLLGETGIDPEFYVCGLFISKVPDIDKALSWCDYNQIRQQTADNALIARLHTSTENPLWLPDIAQARNPRLLKSLKQYLSDQGVTFIEHCQVNRLESAHGKVTALHADSGSFSSEHFIITAGAWTSELLAPFSPSVIDIHPVKGQMLIFEARPDTLTYMILDNDRYLIPRRDGKILVGSTVEQAGFDKSTSDAAKEELYQFATGILPTLKNFPVTHHWAGLRPGTRDGIPYIGQHPEWTNLSINAGHFRNGLGMGPASAELLVDLILKRRPCVNPEPYQIPQTA